MTKQETKLENIEKKLNVKSKVKNWIKVELSRGVFTVPDGRQLTEDQYLEFRKGLQPDTGVILITRIDAPRPKED